MSQESIIRCPKLPQPPPLDPVQANAAFANAQVLTMGTLHPHPPSDNQPGLVKTEVRIGWTPEALWVLTTMEDKDIYNSATKLNQNTWSTGDVFEIFIRNDETTRYWELHVTPENQHLQLCWPERESISKARAAKTGLGSFYVWDPAFASWTHVDAAANRWQTLVKLPATLLHDYDTIKENSIWHFSFCRYDYDRSKEKPTLYSTTQHQEYDFHHMASWRKLVFANSL